MPITVQQKPGGVTYQAPVKSFTSQQPNRAVTVTAPSNAIDVQAPARGLTVVTDDLEVLSGLEGHYDAAHVNGLEATDPDNESYLATWVDISGNRPSKNKVTYDTATLENSIGNWTWNNNCSVSRVQTQYLSGSWSLQASSTAAGDFAVRTIAGVSAVSQQPVTGGKAYTLHAMVRGSIARTNFLSFAWVNSAGVYINSSSAGFVTSTTTGWTKLTVTAVSPSNAAGFYTFWTVQATAAAGELHYLDNYGYWEGTSTDWVAPSRPARNLVQVTQAWRPQFLSTSKNLLTHNQATIETDTTGWNASNVTISRVSTEEHSGGYSLKVESTVATPSTAYTTFTNRSDWVGSTVTGSIWVKGEGAAIGKGFRLYLQGYSSAPAWVAEVSTLVTLTGSWQQVTRTWTNVPANITNIRLAAYHNAPAIADVFYIDTASLHFGSSTTDSPPISTPNNYPAVLCQGIQGMRAATGGDWDFTSGPTAKFSVYVVAKVESPAVLAISSLTNTNPWSSNVDGFYLRRYDGSGGYIHAAQGNGVSGQNQMSVSTGASSAPPDQFGVYSIIVDAAAPQITVSSNGVATSSSVQNFPPVGPPHNQYPLGIGTYTPGVAGYEQNVSYLEVLAFSTNHDASTRLSIERSLGSKYGITVA
jgi:hypothetical protein